MQHNIIWSLFSFIAIASASASSYNATLLTSFFYQYQIDDYLTQPFLHTKNNILSYSIENTIKGLVPQFASINIKQGSVSLILQDISTACGQNYATYTRIHYHADTSTLVYYCTSNNTLLILDEDDYTVQSTVPVGISTVFNETKLYTEGDSVVILGMGGVLPSANPTPAQLIKINLSTKQVVRQVILDKGLENGEAVIAYTSMNLLSFVLTSQVQGDAWTMKIYSAIFVSNVYKLIQLAGFNYTNNSTVTTSELLCLGSYLVTNDDERLLFFNLKGEIVYNFTDIGFYHQFTPTEDFLVPIYAMQHGSSNLYRHFTNGTKPFSVIQISVNGQDLSTAIVCNSEETHIVLGNQYSHDLLLATIDPTFFIMDLETLQEVYLTYIHGPPVITNSTYCFVEGDIKVYDLKNSTLLKSVPISVPNIYYYEPATQVIYYLSYETQEATNCTLMYFNPEDFTTGSVLSFDKGVPCSLGTFIDIQPTENITKPNFILQMVSFTNQTKEYFSFLYLIYNPAYHLIEAIFPAGENSLREGNFVSDYDAMEFYYLFSNVDADYSTVNKYNYDPTTQSFDLQKSYNLTDIPSAGINYVAVDTKTIAGISTHFNISTQYVYTIDLEEGVVTKQDYSSFPIYIDKFHDANGETYLLMSGLALTLEDVPYIAKVGEALEVLPMDNEFTQSAEVVGYSSISVEESVGGMYVRKIYGIGSFSEKLGVRETQRQSRFDLFDILQ